MSRVNTPPPAIPGGPVGPAITPRFGIEAEISSNDPTLSVTKLGNGAFKLSGIASNNGFAPSTLQARFAGQAIAVPLNGGTTAQQAAKKLEGALPAGYALVKIPDGRSTLVFGIVEQAQAKPKRNDPRRIADGFAPPQQPKGPAGAKVSKRQLQRIVRNAKKNGLVTAEKRELAQQFASLFTGPGFNATGAKFPIF
jgi:hypothetical protein